MDIVNVARALNDLSRVLAEVAEAIRLELETPPVTTSLELACPKTLPHSRHTWQFPDSVAARVCPGVRMCPLPFTDTTPACRLTRPHPAHRYRRGYCPGVLGAADPEPVPGHRCPYAGVSCGQTVAHASHDTEEGHCHGKIRGHDHARNNFVLAADVEPCPDEASHVMHVWAFRPPTDADNGLRWCRGALCFAGKAVPMPCPSGRLHPAHTWEDPQDFYTLKACPGHRSEPEMVTVKRCLEAVTHGPHNWKTQGETVACPGRPEPY